MLDLNVIHCSIMHVGCQRNPPRMVGSKPAWYGAFHDQATSDRLARDSVTL